MSAESVTENVIPAIATPGTPATDPSYLATLVAKHTGVEPTLDHAGRLDARALASALSGRMELMRLAGITFDGKRDSYQVLGYGRVISNKEYRDRYLRGGLAGRIVDVYPNACWRGEMEVVEGKDPGTDTTFEAAWKSIAKRLRITAVLQRADKLSQLSAYSVLLIGAPGDINQELPRGNPDQLAYLTPFAGGGGPGLMQSAGFAQSSGATYVDATIQAFETDATSPRFGLPTSYQLRRLDVTSPQLQKPVHWSRIIHLAEGVLDNEVYGLPALERVWNLLDDLDKVTGGGAEAFWLRANQGIQLDIAKDMDLPPAEKEALTQQAEDYSNQMRRMLRTRGVTVNTLGSDVAAFSNEADAIITQIAGSKGIPKRLLMGSEMGELASSQDRDNWKDQVNGRQTQYLAPYVVRQLVDRLVAYGYLPTPTGGAMAYDVKWPHIQTLTESEKADGAKKWADVNSAAGMTIFTEAEIRDKWYGLEPAEEDEQEKWRADLALKMAMANKTQGRMVFTAAEIRKTCYDWAPLLPEEETPIGAPEKISVATPPGVDDGGVPVPPVPLAALAALTSTTIAAEDAEMVAVLRAALEAKNTTVIDRILGLTRE